MILPAHNSHITAIQSPAVPADPGLGIVGSPPTNRWTGDCQAYVDEDTQDSIAMGQRVTTALVIVEVPVTIPVEPRNEDLLQIRYISGATETLIVRFIDRGPAFLGKFRVQCRRD